MSSPAPRLRNGGRIQTPDVVRGTRDDHDWRRAVSMRLDRERRPMTQAQAIVVVYLGLILVVSSVLHARPWWAEVGASPHDRSQVWSWRLIEGLFLVVLVAFAVGLGRSLLRATIWASAADNRPAPFWPTGLATAGTAVWLVALAIGSVRRWLLRRTGR